MNLVKGSQGVEVHTKPKNKVTYYGIISGLFSPLVRGLTFENIVTPESLSLMNDFGHTKVMVEQIISGSNTS